MGVPKWGSPGRSHQNSKFLTTHSRHVKFFWVSKYEKKIKFDKIWGHQNKGVPLKRGRQNLNFGPQCHALQ